MSQGNLQAGGPPPLHVVIPDLNRGPSLPQSIAFHRDTDVAIQIQPSLAGTPDVINFSVIGSSAQNGEAVVVQGAQRKTSGAVTLHGTHQTSPGHAGNLRLVARLNGGAPVWQSSPFSVCAHPCGVENGPHHVAYLHNPGAVAGIVIGMEVRIVIVSDSGNAVDLDQVTEREVVSDTRDRSASMNGFPKWNVQVQKQLQPVPHVNLDRHTVNVMALRGMLQAHLQGNHGEWSQDQVDEFQCARCGMLAPMLIPASGYRITRAVEIDGTGQLWLRVTKFGFGCTVGPWTSHAGGTGLLEVLMCVPPSGVAAGFVFP